MGAEPLTHVSVARYLADEEASALGHIVLRLPPYHCQYNPIELVWGIMKRHYDKHIGEYGDFTPEKCYRKWEEFIGKITPTIWRSVIEINRLIMKDYKGEVGDNQTDYSTLKFSVGDSSDSEDDGGFEDGDSEDKLREGRQRSSHTSSSDKGAEKLSAKGCCRQLFIKQVSPVQGASITV